MRGQVGELVIRQPWPGMTQGFWHDEERYLKTYWSRFPDMWVHGDWASIDDAGYWYIHGRSDDTINVAGKRVGPAEYESAIVAHPGVREVAAVSVPDEMKGETVVCLVVLRNGVAGKRNAARRTERQGHHRSWQSARAESREVRRRPAPHAQRQDDAPRRARPLSEDGESWRPLGARKPVLARGNRRRPLANAVAAGVTRVPGTTPPPA